MYNNVIQSSEQTNRNMRLPELNQVPRNKILWMCLLVYLLSDEHRKSEGRLFRRGPFVSKIKQETIQYHYETSLTLFSQ